jgi:hypothetical protein
MTDQSARGYIFAMDIYLNRESVKMKNFSRTEALLAMKKMNQSYLSSASNQPIVVKFADTQKEKEKRKLERQVTKATNNIFAKVVFL